MMHAAVGEFAHLLHHVALRGIDDVGGAELGGELQLRRIGVDRDDAAGAGDLRTVDRRHADAAAADHRDGLAGLNLGRVHDRAVAGDDAAADQRREIERHVLADFDDGVFVHQHLLGERREIEELVQLLRPAPRTAGWTAPGSIFTVVSVQSTVRPVVQLSQVPQNTDRQVTT